MAILYLRFGSKALQDNFVAELSTHYQNYILYFTLVLSVHPITDELFYV